MNISCKNQYCQLKTGFDDGYVLYNVDQSGSDNAAGYITTWRDPIPVVEGHQIQITGIPIPKTHCWLLDENYDYSAYYTFYNRTIIVQPGQRFMIFSVFSQFKNNVRIVDVTDNIVLFENGNRLTDME